MLEPHISQLFRADPKLPERLSAFRNRVVQDLYVHPTDLTSKKPPFEIIQFLNNLDPRSYLADIRWSGSGPHFPTPLDDEEVGRIADYSWTIPCLQHEHVRRLWREVVNPGKPVDQELPFPGFYVAAPRTHLDVDLFGLPRLKIGILTAGGLAPGLNTVVHRILRRHEIYVLNALAKNSGNAALLEAYGYRDGFNGLCRGEYIPLMSNLRSNERHKAIHPDAMNRRDFQDTDLYKNLGGSFLGAARGDDKDSTWLSNAAKFVRDHHLDILYCIGGNGTVTGTYMLEQELQKSHPSTRICVIPKTIDNDLLWAENSFGFQSSVDKGVAALEEMHTEALGTNRVAIVQFMGRDSGFIAANASLASGITHLCLVPEVHRVIDVQQIKQRFKSVLDNGKGHALIAIAEGCRASAWRNLPRGFSRKYQRPPSTEKELKSRLPAGQLLYEALRADSSHVVFHDAGYVVRSIAPNPSDRILCRRLANLAVDNILAGYDRFVIAPVLTGNALVPLRLAADIDQGGLGGPKTINRRGRFWAEVASRNDQFAFDRLAFGDPSR